MTVDVWGCGDDTNRTLAAKDKLELVDGLLLNVAMLPLLLLLLLLKLIWEESVNKDIVELMLGDLLNVPSSTVGDNACRLLIVSLVFCSVFDELF